METASQSSQSDLGLTALQTHLCSQLVGREILVERLLIALLTRGHILIEGAPGLAKTRAVKLFASAIEAKFSRIQFTPDLLPSDLTGTVVYQQAEGRFDFYHGPLFSNIVLVDEINRAPPKVQSALLEVMAERQITVSGETRQLDEPFLVAATQNSIEHEGTYPLPEAQLDRFLFTIEIDMPDIEGERKILDLAMTENLNGSVMDNFVLPADSLSAAWQLIPGVHVSEAIKDYIVRLTHATREDVEDLNIARYIEFPASPRASIGMAQAAQARAWLHGRDHVLPEDVQCLAVDVLRGRIGLNYQGRAEGMSTTLVARQIVERIAPL